MEMAYIQEREREGLRQTKTGRERERHIIKEQK